jgi:hypothetical protein
MGDRAHPHQHQPLGEPGDHWVGHVTQHVADRGAEGEQQLDDVGRQPHVGRLHRGGRQQVEPARFYGIADWYVLSPAMLSQLWAGSLLGGEEVHMVAE